MRSTHACDVQCPGSVSKVHVEGGPHRHPDHLSCASLHPKLLGTHVAHRPVGLGVAAPVPAVPVDRPPDAGAPPSPSSWTAATGARPSEVVDELARGTPCSQPHTAPGVRLTQSGATARAESRPALGSRPRGCDTLFPWPMSSSAPR